MNRIPFDSLNLYAILQECQRLVGGRIRHIGQPRPLEIVLTVYARHAEHRLLISAEAQFARLHLSTIKQPNPMTPPPFCSVLRKHLEGGFIRAIQQIDFDRIARIEVESHDGLTYYLMAELMGKHSNLILTTASGTILGAVKWISPSKSRVRPIQPHQSYQLPPTHKDGLLNPLLASRGEIENRWEDGRMSGRACGRSDSSTPNAQCSMPKWLMEHFEGLSTFTATEIAERCREKDIEGFCEWQQQVLAGQWQPVLIRGEREMGKPTRERAEGRTPSGIRDPGSAIATPIGAYPFHTVQFPEAWQHPRDSISLAWEHYFREAIPRALSESLRRQLVSNLQRALRARQEALEDVEYALSQGRQAQKWQLYGELILAFGYGLPPHSRELEAPDYNQPDAPLVRIPLDPDKSPVENAEVYFAKARHSRESQGGLHARKERLANEGLQLQAFLDRVEIAGDNPETLQGLLEEAHRQGWLRQVPTKQEGRGKPEKAPFEAHKIRAFTSEDGYQVLLGESATANDFLTVRVARPNDWWFHVRTGTGAHVVIRTDNHPERVPRRTLEFAARLAARHSSDKHASVVIVNYTLRKYVRKPRGAPPGMVLCSHEKTIYVRDLKV